MAKYLVAGDRFSLGHWIDGDPVDGRPQRVWAHTVYSRGDTVEMSSKDAERHLTDGALAKPADFVEDPPAGQAYDDLGNNTSEPSEKVPAPAPSKTAESSSKTSSKT